MDRLPTFSPAFDPFIFLSWTLTAASSIWIAVTYRRNRALFVKPSMLVLLWSHVFFQWPASIYASYYEAVLPNPYALALLLHGFVLTGLLVSTQTFHESAEEVFHRLKLPQPTRITLPTVLLGIYCIGVVAAYLMVVPLTSTGLYVILTHPALAATAREDSLKLISSAPLRYAYQIMANAAAPLLAVNLALGGFRAARARKLIWTLVNAALFFMLALIASLPGNRGTAAKLLLVVALAQFLLRGLPFRPFAALAGITAILTPAVLITVLREGKEFSGGLFFSYLTEGIFNRVFVVPVNVGTFYIHYAQVYGPFGIAGVNRLASVLGVDPIRAANVIGNLYTYSGIESVSANAGFLFTYYGYFGILSLPLSLAGLWLLDIALPIYLRLDRRVLLPTVAAASMASLAFISSEYTTVLVTHGFAIILVLGLLLTSCLRLSSDRDSIPLQPPGPSI